MNEGTHLLQAETIVAVDCRTQAKPNHAYENETIKPTDVEILSFLTECISRAEKCTLFHLVAQYKIKFGVSTTVQSIYYQHICKYPKLFERHKEANHIIIISMVPDANRNAKTTAPTILETIKFFSQQTRVSALSVATLAEKYKHKFGESFYIINHLPLDTFLNRLDNVFAVERLMTKIHSLH
jgi:hypothetical protein